ncbi:hypothetical protein ScPMuIL_012576 [Solemya velum]
MRICSVVKSAASASLLLVPEPVAIMMCMWDITNAESQCSQKAAQYGIPVVNMCLDSIVNASRMVVDVTEGANTPEQFCNCTMRPSDGIASSGVSFTLMPDVYPSQPGYPDCGSRILFLTRNGQVTFNCYVTGEFVIEADSYLTFEKIRHPNDTNYCMLVDTVDNSKLEIECNKPETTTVPTTTTTTTVPTTTSTTTVPTTTSTTTLPTTTSTTTVPTTTSTTVPTTTSTTTVPTTTSTTVPTTTSTTTTVPTTSTTTTVPTTSTTTTVPTTTSTTTTVPTTSQTTTSSTSTSTSPQSSPDLTTKTTISTTTTHPDTMTSTEDTPTKQKTTSSGAKTTSPEPVTSTEMTTKTSKPKDEETIQAVEVLFPLSQGIMLGALGLLLLAVCCIRIRRATGASFNSGNEQSTSSLKVINDSQSDQSVDMTEQTPPIIDHDIPITKAVIDNRNNENVEMIQQPTQSDITTTTVAIDNLEDQDVKEKKNTPTTVQNDTPVLFAIHSETSDYSELINPEVLTPREDGDDIETTRVQTSPGNSSSKEMVMNFDSDTESENPETVSGNSVTPVYAQINKKKLSLKI